MNEGPAPGGARTLCLGRRIAYSDIAHTCGLPQSADSAVALRRALAATLPPRKADPMKADPEMLWASLARLCVLPVAASLLLILAAVAALVRGRVILSPAELVAGLASPHPTARRAE